MWDYYKCLIKKKNDIAVKDSLHPSVQYNIVHICHYLKKKIT